MSQSAGLIPCFGLWSSCRPHQGKPSWEQSVLNLQLHWVFHLPQQLDPRWSPLRPRRETPAPPGCLAPLSAHTGGQCMRDIQTINDTGCGLVTRLWVFAETVCVSFGFQMTISASDPTAMRPEDTETEIYHCYIKHQHHWTGSMSEQKTDKGMTQSTVGAGAGISYQSIK